MRIYPFSAVITDATSKFRKIKASDYKTEGRFKIIDQGQKDIAGYTDDESLINRTHSPIIVFGDHTRALKYEESPIALGADGAKALSVNPAIANALYVYYYLRTINLKEAGYSRHFKFLKQVEIPIPEKDGEPDFDDQKRIAHLLGKVEGLMARRKQHLQQLNDLIKSVFLEMFGDPVRNDKGWEKKPLSKLGNLDRGVSKHRPRNAPELLGGKYPLIQTGDVSNAGTYITKFTQTYSEVGFTQSKLWPAGTLCITIAANIAQTGVLTFDACFPDSVVGFTADENESNPLYVLGLFWFFQRILEKNAPAAAQKNINLRILRELEVPSPPITHQNQFAAIVETVEGLKSRYQQSLADLESLYGALSQKAFKGELDLSRVVLPAEGPEIFEEEKTDIEEKQPMEPLFELPAPEEIAVLHTVEGRKSLLGEWLNAWLAQLCNAPFVAQKFMDAARQRLWELAEDDAPNWGVAEYDELKDWVFEQIESGKLKQTRNIICINEKKQFGNQVILRTRKSRLQ
jgi:type I restriction enzyme S subunit